MNGHNVWWRARLIAGVVSTDDILPARYKHMYTDPVDLAPHVFENYRQDFARSIRPGDVLVSDSLFGIGSSREQAVSALISAGICAIVAPSFGRIFFRNAWNLALPAVEVHGVVVEDGDRIRVSLDEGIVETARQRHRFHPVPPPMLQTLREGGLLACLANTLNDSRDA